MDCVIDASYKVSVLHMIRFPFLKGSRDHVRSELWEVGIDSLAEVRIEDLGQPEMPISLPMPWDRSRSEHTWYPRDVKCRPSDKTSFGVTSPLETGSFIAFH
jgi:hypothetical protein